MATTPFVHLGGVNLSTTVLDNLKPGSPGQAFISQTLNAALKAQLTAAATNAKQTALVRLFQAMPAADLAADKDLSIHDFSEDRRMRGKKIAFGEKVALALRRPLLFYEWRPFLGQEVITTAASAATL